MKARIALRIAVLVCTLVFFCGLTPTRSWADAEKGSLEWKIGVVEEATLSVPLEVDVGIMWDDCLGQNGFYYHLTTPLGKDYGEILLCNENLERGIPFARGILLHELGHALTFQWHFSFDRWGGNYEAAADEFFAISALVQGHPEDLYAVAGWFEELGGTHKKNDPHPSHEARAARFRSLLLGYYLPWSPLAADYRETLQWWIIELKKRAG